MHCVASRFGYPNCRLSELSLVPISWDNRRSTILKIFECLGGFHMQYFERHLSFPTEASTGHRPHPSRQREDISLGRLNCLLLLSFVEELQTLSPSRLHERDLTAQLQVSQTSALSSFADPYFGEAQGRQASSRRAGSITFSE